MRIEAYSQIQQLYGNSKVRKTGKGESASFSRDAVEISGLGRDVQFTKQAVKAAPDIREELTAPLRSSEQAGTYNVSGESFAEKLLEKYAALG